MTRQGYTESQPDHIVVVGLPPTAAELEADLQEARAALGVALLVMTPDQQMEWQRRLRAMKAEGAGAGSEAQR